ncbi:MAG: Abi family protein [Clostridia bacterium]|nr:Abi family protein [Clostridia bacterium]
MKNRKKSIDNLKQIAYYISTERTLGNQGLRGGPFMVLPNFFYRRGKMKEFFTYEQQIEKLKKDGLIICDEQYAINELKLEGYYNIINGYSPIFKINNHYKKGTTFDNINKLYDFDKTLRSIVYKYTALIECHVKAIIAHEFSRVHGVDENQYLTTESFSSNASSRANIEKLLSECKQTIQDALNRNSMKYREYIAHNYYNHGHVPMWVLVRALSFGTTSIFYKNMLADDKAAVSNNFNLTAAHLANMLEVVVSFRNIVAHGERTFCARLPKTRLSTDLSAVRKMRIAKNKKGENMFGRNDFLALVICSKYLLTPIEFSGFLTEIESALLELSHNQTFEDYARIRIKMGLSNDSWKTLAKIKTEGD